MMRLGRPSLPAGSGVTQQTVLPERNSRLTPASRIRSTLSELADVPVLVVADADERLALEAAVGREHVAIGTIGHVVAVLFEPVGQRKLERQELARAERERVVDDALELGLAAVGPVEADVGPGPCSPWGGCRRNSCWASGCRPARCCRSTGTGCRRGGRRGR